MIKLLKTKKSCALLGALLFLAFMPRAILAQTNTPWTNPPVGTLPTNFPVQTNDITLMVDSNGLFKTPGAAKIIAANGLLTNGSAQVVATNDPRLTDARIPLTHDQDWSTVTNVPAFLTNETHLGTITGATIEEGTNNAVTTNAGVLAFTVRTNAAGGAGTITNMAPDAVTSIVWSASGGPQPIGSITNYLERQGYKSNSIAIAGGSNISIRVVGSTNYFDNTLVAGTAAGTYYDGANGASVSGRVAALEVPYQAYSAVINAVNSTCTITYASGSLVSITATNSTTTITFDNTDFPTNGVNRVGVDVWAGANTIAFLDATVTNTTPLVFTNKTPASLFFRKSSTNTIWWGRQ